MREVYRDGSVHVCAEMCSTCVFRPGNLMSLGPGRLAEIVRGSVAQDAALTCHSTLDADRAVCRGFFDRYKTTPLQLADRLGRLVFVDAPEWP